MATSTYLKADPIKGESEDDAHKDWIEVLEYSLGVSQPVSGPSGTTGRAAARADFQNLTITKIVDKASVDLHMYCAKGEHIPKLELEICQETGTKVCYKKYEFENVMVQSVNHKGGGSDKPTEVVSFIFDKIAYSYTPVKNDGTAGTTVGPKKWNLQTNKAE